MLDCEVYNYLCFCIGSSDFALVHVTLSKGVQHAKETKGNEI